MPLTKSIQNANANEYISAPSHGRNKFKVLIELKLWGGGEFLHEEVGTTSFPRLSFVRPSIPQNQTYSDQSRVIRRGRVGREFDSWTNNDQGKDVVPRLLGTNAFFGMAACLSLYHADV